MDSFDQKIDFLKRHSLFASRCLLARPDWAPWLAEQEARPVDLAAINTLLEPAKQVAAEPELSELSLMTELRLARQKLMLHLVKGLLKA